MRLKQTLTDTGVCHDASAAVPHQSAPVVALLTGGGDRPYALGLAVSLASASVAFDFIGSDDLDVPELRHNPLIRFLNLRGDQNPDASLAWKWARILRYYARLVAYAATCNVKIFHILWNNKLEFFDRTLLLLYYRGLGKKLVFTVHNVNVRKRDGNDGVLNRLTLRAQYALVHHLFVHTDQMKRELQCEFKVPAEKISVIPFGINSTVPDTDLTGVAARRRLGLNERDKTVLFFGNIAPYKGLEFLVEAMPAVVESLPECRLVIAGRPKGPASYWAAIQHRISILGLNETTVQRIEYVPDADTEVYFKTADVLVLPYTHVFQSGVLFLAYNFGLPVIASDIASLREDILEGETGFVCPPRDPNALAETLVRYFASSLYGDLTRHRAAIRRYADDRYSWTKVAAVTSHTYSTLLPCPRRSPLNRRSDAADHHQHGEQR